MSVEVVNRFTLVVLKELYSHHDYTQNAALSGIALYLAMGAINIGLRGNSYDQLSHFLGEDFDQLLNNETWKNSVAARKLNNLKNRMTVAFPVFSASFYSGLVYPHYEKVSRSIFGVNHHKIDLSNPRESTGKIKRWLMARVHGLSHLKIVKESMMSENKIIFISSTFSVLEWDVKFESENNYIEPFILENDEEIMVEMMNQEIECEIYVPPNQLYKILFKRCNPGDVYAVIVLAKEGWQVEHVLNEIELHRIHNYLKISNQQQMYLSLPKFEIVGAYDFVSPLKYLGVRDIFIRNHSDFGRMTNGSVTVGTLMQVTHLIIDESGVNSGKEEGMMRPGWVNTESNAEKYKLDKRFMVDRPFLFLIYSPEDRLVHFSAVVKKPTALEN